MRLEDNDFQLFGLPERQEQSRADIDSRWKSLQSEVHPDRFTSAGAAAQRVSMQWALRVNEAYRRLRDPLARAAYLCELRGAVVAAQDNTRMPAEFLVEQMGWREALDEAQSVEDIESIDRLVARREEHTFCEVQRLLDVAHDPLAAVEQVRALMFIARLRSEIEHRLALLDTF